MKFVYLIQSASKIVPPMKGDVVQLTWKEKCDGAIHMGSFNET